MDTSWGVATSGVLLASSISSQSVDPFYPAAYGKVSVSEVENAKVSMDKC